VILTRGQPISAPGGLTGIGDMIHTKRFSSAGIILIDGPKIAIDQNSTTLFKNQKGIDVNSATVVVDLKKT
jgi:hypothetical protein